MSLKAFHILFIALSFALALAFGGWCIWYAGTVDHAGYRMAGVVSFVAAAALAVYGVWFLRKLRRWDEDRAVSKTRSLHGLVLVTVALFTPAVAGACPVCYGEAESPWIDASQAAVFLLLGVTVGVQVAFAAFFLRLRRRTKTLEARRAEMGLVQGRGAA